MKNALRLICIMEFDDIIKTFRSRTVNMIEAQPTDASSLLERE